MYLRLPSPPLSPGEGAAWTSPSAVQGASMPLLSDLLARNTQDLNVPPGFMLCIPCYLCQQPFGDIESFKAHLTQHAAEIYARNTGNATNMQPYIPPNESAPRSTHPFHMPVTFPPTPSPPMGPMPLHPCAMPFPLEPPMQEQRQHPMPPLNQVPLRPLETMVARVVPSIRHHHPYPLHLLTRPPLWLRQGVPNQPLPHQPLPNQPLPNQPVPNLPPVPVPIQHPIQHMVPAPLQAEPRQLPEHRPIVSSETPETVDLSDVEISVDVEEQTDTVEKPKSPAVQILKDLLMKRSGQPASSDPAPTGELLKKSSEQSESSHPAATLRPIPTKELLKTSSGQPASSDPGASTEPLPTGGLLKKSSEQPASLDPAASTKPITTKESLKRSSEQSESPHPVATLRPIPTKELLKTTSEQTTSSIPAASTEPTPTNDRFDCKLCKKKLSSRQSLKYHSRVFHQIDDLPTDRIGRHVQKLFKCNVCKKRYKRQTFLKLHLKYSHGVVSPCMQAEKPASPTMDCETSPSPEESAPPPGSELGRNEIWSTRLYNAVAAAKYQPASEPAAKYLPASDQPARTEPGASSARQPKRTYPMRSPFFNPDLWLDCDVFS
ncbi:proteoglycan 4 [Drosophila bipectinata]|uniref:proteoglycan 4 n=1 Tax=Drosophila bipectinata TaxID=42026 RepID=UPI001C8A3DAB|nr:proteoglycan 4 [Drosophila bipectinata]